jgi:secondary thiamine-phosphate synthase enzyme
MPEIILSSSQREQLIDITTNIEELIRAAGWQDGLCHLWCLHTTAGLLCNEHADPDVAGDILLALRQIVPDGLPYRHAEGNSTAHVKSVLTGCSLQLPIRGGRLALGRWQGVFFAEFDGPRRGRSVLVSFVPVQEPDAKKNLH